jgi:hypothetical protein
VNAIDSGWPIKGELHVLLQKPDPQLIGPQGFWRASDARTLHIEAAFQTHEKRASVFWKRFDDDHFTEAKSVSFVTNPDGQYHAYDIDLSSCSEYRGAITGIRIDPCESANQDEWVKVRSIEFRK